MMHLDNLIVIYNDKAIQQCVVCAQSTTESIGFLHVHSDGSIDARMDKLKTKLYSLAI